ncbi:MAG TPA: NifB/NifX family molybdenum-iron cluster-binding protein [Chromobacteriaceae bacterium]|nr:NifB/NifX family molybdenum-iron cluster-binding protein [Chromobacteriaceae bacterium]
MLIAVCAQNGHSVTPHAGKCCRFVQVELDEQDGRCVRSELLQIPATQRFQLHPDLADHPLRHATVLIAGSMGDGLALRLKASGIVPVVTTESDPVSAAQAWWRKAVTTLEVCPAVSGHALDGSSGCHH